MHYDVINYTANLLNSLCRLCCVFIALCVGNYTNFDCICRDGWGRPGRRRRNPLKSIVSGIPRHWRETDGAVSPCNSETEHERHTPLLMRKEKGGRPAQLPATEIGPAFGTVIRPDPGCLPEGFFITVPVGLFQKTTSSCTNYSLCSPTTTTASTTTKLASSVIEWVQELTHLEYHFCTNSKDWPNGWFQGSDQSRSPPTWMFLNLLTYSIMHLYAQMIRSKYKNDNYALQPSPLY